MADSACLEQLQDRLGYHFKDDVLLRIATTHRSSDSGVSNERLEFLGDAVIGLIVGRMLYSAFPEDAEGTLSKKRSQLVRTGSLARMADELHIGECLTLGGGEENTGGRKKEHILEDAVEAVFGAIYLDGGYEAARLVAETLFKPLIGTVDVAESRLQDYKSILQERVQASKSGAGISYTMTQMDGPPHCPTFTVELAIGGSTVSEGTGASKKFAEQQAAQAAVSRFGELVAPLLERFAK